MLLDTGDPRNALAERAGRAHAAASRGTRSAREVSVGRTRRVRRARAAEIRRAIAFAKRYGMKPVIAGGAEAWVVADELAREKVRCCSMHSRICLHVRRHRRATRQRCPARSRGRAHRVHAVQRESQRAQGPPARGQCGRSRLAEGCGARGADVQPAEIFRSRGDEGVSRAGRLRIWCCGMAIRSR
jgi:hypothetical protein